MATSNPDIPGTTVQGLPGRLRARAQALQQEYEQVQGEATMVSLQRFQWLVWLAIPLHLILAWWFSRYETPAGHPELERWADALSQVHGSTGVVVLLLALFVRWVIQAKGQATAGAIGLQILLSLAYLGFGGVVSLIDMQAGAPAGISPYITVCIAIGVLSLMRPGLSIPVFLSGLVAFWLLLYRSDLSGPVLPSLVVNSVSTTLLALLASITLWHQYVKGVLLTRQLTRANQALATKQQELEFLAERDYLTGLYNRRRFVQLLEVELARRVRFPSGLCLLMVDLDHFKAINDRHGHLAGDAAIKHAATVLTECLRSVDVVARMGGEEFVVLLPNTEPADAMKVAEKLRLTLAQPRLVIAGAPLTITASIGATGLASYERASVEDLYAAADRALYQAKDAGRNQVVFCVPPATGALSTFDRMRV